MSIIDPEITDDDTDPEENRDLRNLRAKAKKADELETTTAQLQADNRELAFFKAGLTADDLASELGKLFVAGYTGESDPTAIQASWAAVSGNRTVVPADETSTLERQALSSDGFPDTGNVPTKPVRGIEGTAVKAGFDVLGQGGTRDDAAGTTFAALVDAAAAGDQTVILPPGGGIRE